MKNIFKLCSLLVVAALFAACDPTEKDYSNNALTYSSDEIAGLVSFLQADADGNPQTDGNYITYYAKTGVVLYNLNADGSENVLARGSQGSFKLAPPRGSDANQTVYVRAMNADGSTVDGSVTLTVAVAGDLSEEMKLICSNSGSKTWTWKADSKGRVWGNAGYDNNETWGNSIWWGCGLINSGALDDNGNPNEFDTVDSSGKSQIDKISTTGDANEVTLGAYMVFSEDGTVKKYSKDGELLGTGTFEISDWTGGEQVQQIAGKIKITKGALLFPFKCDSDNPAMVEEYNIVKLTNDELLLTYTEASFGSWGTVTWWSFGSSSDYEGMLTDNGSKDWTWNPDSKGRVWGNAGYDNNDTWGNSIWWGCGLINSGALDDNGNPNEFDTVDSSGKSQIDMISTTGDAEEVTVGAYMTFSNDGTVTKYSKDGKALASGTYEVSGYTDGQQVQQIAGKIKITKGALLFPFKCDSDNPAMVEDYNIVSLSDNELILTYTEATFSSWGTVTWWRLKKKE